MTLEVRNATAEYVSVLVKVYHTAYRENKRMGFPSSVLECDTDDVADWLRNRTVLVAKREDEIVGVVQLIPRSDWDTPEIGRLAVSPDYQGEGIGQLLLESVEEHAKADGQDSIHLRTLSRHPFLEDWYRQEGYERIGIERLSNRPYDVPIMEKEL
ncbi:GNAT family N-acetyltransferase [Haladaptatus pallidirubidus]